MIEAGPIAAPMRHGKLEDEPLDVYHASAAVSRTKLEVFRRSPKLYWKTFIAKTIPKDEPTEALIIGQGVDTLALEGPEAFAQRFITVPEGAPKRPTKRQIEAKKPSPATREAIMFYEAFDEQAKGKMALDSDQLELVKRCADALHSDPTFAKLMAGGKSQVTFRIKGDHISLQCRPDRWCEDGNELTDGMPCVLDVKTIQELPADQVAPGDSADDIEDHLPRHIAKFGYHRGAWLYPEIIAKVLRYRDGYRPPFILCFVEKQEPYTVSCRPVSDLAVEIGEREVRDLLHKMIRCVERNHWPEWWNDPMKSVGLPDYYVRKALAGTDPHLFG